MVLGQQEGVLPIPSMRRRLYSGRGAPRSICRRLLDSGRGSSPIHLICLVPIRPHRGEHPLPQIFREVNESSEQEVQNRLIGSKLDSQSPANLEAFVGASSSQVGGCC